MHHFSLWGGISASDSISGQGTGICYFNDNVPIAFHTLRNYAVADIKVVWSSGWYTYEFESRYLQISNVIEICKLLFNF